MGRGQPKSRTGGRRALGAGLDPQAGDALLAKAERLFVLADELEAATDQLERAAIAQSIRAEVDDPVLDSSPSSAAAIRVAIGPRPYAPVVREVALTLRQAALANASVRAWPRLEKLVARQDGWSAASGERVAFIEPHDGGWLIGLGLSNETWVADRVSVRGIVTDADGTLIKEFRPREGSERTVDHVRLGLARVASSGLVSRYRKWAALAGPRLARDAIAHPDRELRPHGRAFLLVSEPDARGHRRLTLLTRGGRLLAGDSVRADDGLLETRIAQFLSTSAEAHQTAVAAASQRRATLRERRRERARLAAIQALRRDLASRRPVGGKRVAQMPFVRCAACGSTAAAQSDTVQTCARGCSNDLTYVWLWVWLNSGGGIVPSQDFDRVAPAPFEGFGGGSSGGAGASGDLQPTEPAPIAPSDLGLDVPARDSSGYSWGGGHDYGSHHDGGYGSHHDSGSSHDSGGSFDSGGGDGGGGGGGE